MYTITPILHWLHFFWQFDALKKYLDGGGSIFVMLGEGGETRFPTNINFLLEEFGVMLNTGEFSVDVDQWCS